MKRFYSKFRIALMTFALGLASVWMFNNFQLAKDYSETNIIDFENTTFISNVSISNIKFFPTSRGCGGGYTQSYLTTNGQHLSEGVWRISQKKFRDSLKKAEIIEKIEGAENRFGEKGLRIVTKNLDENGEEYFEILWYGNGKIHNITARTLEIALKFEKDKSYAY